MTVAHQMIDEVATLRAQLKANPRAHLELLAAVSVVMRNNGIDISLDLLRDIVLTTSAEMGTAHEVVLPVGNVSCPIARSPNSPNPMN